MSFWTQNGKNLIVFSRRHWEPGQIHREKTCWIPGAVPSPLIYQEPSRGTWTADAPRVGTMPLLSPRMNHDVCVQKKHTVEEKLSFWGSWDSRRGDAREEERREEAKGERCMLSIPPISPPPMGWEGRLKNREQSSTAGPVSHFPSLDSGEAAYISLGYSHKRGKPTRQASPWKFHVRASLCSGEAETARKGLQAASQRRPSQRGDKGCKEPSRSPAGYTEDPPEAGEDPPAVAKDGVSARESH